MKALTRFHKKLTSKINYSTKFQPLSNRIFYIPIFLFLFTLSGIAQKNNLVEFDVDDDYIDATVIPVKEKGLLYVSFSKVKSSKNDKFSIAYYSKDLTKQKTESFSVEPKSYVFDAFADQDINFTLVLDNDNHYSLIYTDLTKQKSSKTDGELPKNTYVQQFVILGNYLYIRAVVGKQNSLLQINLTNKSLKEMPIRIGDNRRNNIYPQDIQVVDNELLAFVKVDIDKKTVDLYMLKYSKDGQLLKTINLTKDIKEKIVKLEACVIDGKVLLSGTYSKSKDEYAQGVIFAELTDDKVINVKLYNFLDLENFTSGMSNREQKAIDRKKDYQNDKNKELFINLFMVIHPLEKTSNGFCLVGEAYKPIYATTYGANGTSYSTLVGFNYTQAVVLMLDNTGKLIWDQSLKMDVDVLPNKVKKYVTVSENSSGDITLSFAEESKIKSKSMNASGSVINDNLTDMAKIDDRSSKAKRITAIVEPWYKNYFISYGTRIIPGNQSSKRKQVFFINKISAE
jgi:hypothetical protein